MNVGSNLPFQFTWRGRNFRDASGAEFARIVEERDRELEEFLSLLSAGVGSGGGGGVGDGSDDSATIIDGGTVTTTGFSIIDGGGV